MTQLFPQPRGAGSAVRGSMGAPGKARAPRSVRAAPGLGPALPPRLCAFALDLSSFPFPPRSPSSSLSLSPPTADTCPRGDLFSPSLPPCSRGSGGGTQAGLGVGSSVEDPWVGDPSQGCRWVGRLSEELGFRS